MIIKLITILLTISESVLGEGGKFCYHDPNCDEKSTAWPELCKTGKLQSPIDLPARASVPSLPSPNNFLLAGLMKLLQPQQTFLFGLKQEDFAAELHTYTFKSLNFNDNYSSESFYIVNNGDTIKVQFESSATSSAEMSGYEMEDSYVFAQAHFHWGSKNSEGSEHTIEGKRFSAELHLVHYSRKYKDFSEAAKADDPKSIAVVAVFLQDSPDNSCSVGSPCAEGHKALKPIIEQLPLKYKTEHVKINRQIDFSAFLPATGDPVYRYMGSLTTPNCAEKVIWTVAAKPVLVASSDLKAFYSNEDDEGHPLVNNFRSTQKANREIKFFHVI